MPKCNPIQAIKLFYLYVKFEIDWSNGFQVRVRKPQTDRRTDGQTDGRTHQSNRRIGYTQPAQKEFSAILAHLINHLLEVKFKLVCLCPGPNWTVITEE